MSVFISLKYGLKLKEADEFKLKSIDTGSFMHDVVDNFFEEVRQEELKTLTKEEVKQIVYRIIEQKLNLKKVYVIFLALVIV